jgi:signal peptidase II
MSAVKIQPVDSCVFLFLLALDQVSKILSLAYLIPGKPLALGALFGVRFDLLLTTNQGAAWGALSAYPGLLLAVRLIFIVCLAFIYLGYAGSFSYRITVLAILAGAVGNIIDSLFWGHVVDMIHVTLWGWDYPVFNLADTWIFLGCVTFLFRSFFEKKRA